MLDHMLKQLFRATGPPNAVGAFLKLQPNSQQQFRQFSNQNLPPYFSLLSRASEGAETLIQSLRLKNCLECYHSTYGLNPMSTLIQGYFKLMRENLELPISHWTLHDYWTEDC